MYLPTEKSINFNYQKENYSCNYGTRVGVLVSRFFRSTSSKKSQISATGSLTVIENTFWQVKNARCDWMIVAVDSDKMCGVMVRWMWRCNAYDYSPTIQINKHEISRKWQIDVFIHIITVVSLIYTYTWQRITSDILKFFYVFPILGVLLWCSLWAPDESVR